MSLFGAKSAIFVDGLSIQLSLMALVLAIGDGLVSTILLRMFLCYHLSLVRTLHLNSVYVRFKRMVGHFRAQR